MEVVDLKDSQLIWAPCGATADIYREGMLVADGNVLNTEFGDGVENVGAAAGVLDTTSNRTLRGIVVGNNDRTKVADATYGGSNITSPAYTQAGLTGRSVSRADGVWGMDRQGMVQIALIDASTKIKAPLYVTTHGTAPTLLTVTTGSTDGLGFTSNACDFTPVAGLATSYCRTGANAGRYRISDDTSTTVETNDVPFEYDIAIGDTFVRVPLRSFGLSYVQTDAEATFFDVATAPGQDGATHSWGIHVLYLDLSEAGKEHVVFTFDPIHFLAARA